MTNNLVLLSLSLVLAVCAAIFPLRRQATAVAARGGEIRAGAIVTAIVLLAFLAATLIWPTTFVNGSTLASALAIGAFVGVACASFDPAFTVLPLALGALGVALVHLLPGSAGGPQLAYCSGAFIAAFATSALRPKMHGGYLAVLASVLIVSADYLGYRAAGSDVAFTAGLALAIVALIGCVVTGVFRRNSESVTGPAIGLLVAIGAGYLACSRYLGDDNLAMIWPASIVVGTIVHFIFEGEGEPTALRFALATIIWVAAATVAFGMKLGLGMAVGLLGGASALVILGSVRGLMSMAVAGSILVYRFFREMQPEGARALDIGQHYSMVGICFGALLPLLPIEWSRRPHSSVSPSARTAIAVALWIVVLVGVPVAAATLLGSKGAVGLIVGLGFASLVEGLRGAATLEPAGLALGLGTLITLSYGWLAPWMDLARPEKTRALIIMSVIIALVAAVLYALAPKATASETK